MGNYHTRIRGGDTRTRLIGIMKRYLLLVSLLVIMIAALTLGNIPEPEKVRVVPRIIIKEIPVIIEKPIIRIMREVLTVERVVEIPVDLTDWSSLEELQNFLDKDDTDEVLVLVANPATGLIVFNGQCGDRAFNLRARASQIGKRLETEALTRDEYIKYYGEDGGLGENDGHYINKAVIGNMVYFVEPSTDYVWLVYYLDKEENQ